MFNGSLYFSHEIKTNNINFDTAPKLFVSNPQIHK